MLQLGFSRAGWGGDEWFQKQRWDLLLKLLITNMVIERITFTVGIFFYFTEHKILLIITLRRYKTHFHLSSYTQWHQKGNRINKCNKKWDLTLGHCSRCSYGFGFYSILRNLVFLPVPNLSGRLTLKFLIMMSWSWRLLLQKADSCGINAPIGSSGWMILAMFSFAGLMWNNLNYCICHSNEAYNLSHLNTHTHTHAWSPHISSVSLILTDGLNHLCILDCILPQLLLSVFTLCCLHDLPFTLNLHKLFAASFPTPPVPPLGSALPRSRPASPQRCLIYFNLIWCYFIWRAVTSDGSAGIWGGGSTACAIRHTPQHPLSMHTAYVHLCARQKTSLGKN